MQDAIDSQDFNRLNQTITNTINSAMGGVGKGLSDVGRAARDAYKYQHRAGRSRYDWQRNQNRYTYRAERLRAAGSIRLHSSRLQYREILHSLCARQEKSRRDSYGGNRIHHGKFGTFLALAFAALGIALTSGYFGTWFQIMASIMGVFFAGSLVLGGAGRRRLDRVKRFQAYIQELEGKEYCEIKELAEKLKKPQKYVVKDIEKMIEKKWFLQGHLDRQNTCLIVSDEAYSQYTNLMENVEKQKLEEKLAKERQEEQQKNMDPQLQEIIRAGDEYIKKIRECNDAIPGEEISAKIYRIEMLVDKIFDRIEQNPENISDIRRLMEYYLPTTVKLLEAYQELDAQPVQGENIISSKGEIEKTLDTLNLAFEKLLDSLFKDTAWNVSADISVLNTMLAQEGLTKDDF
ncbi:MAG: 5-bromo-4-chloroindolyl phosphate hydrolysis family protein [Muricomes sp.]